MDEGGMIYIQVSPVTCLKEHFHVVNCLMEMIPGGDVRGEQCVPPIRVCCV